MCGPSRPAPSVRATTATSGSAAPCSSAASPESVNKVSHSSILNFNHMIEGDRHIPEGTSRNRFRRLDEINGLFSLQSNTFFSTLVSSFVLVFASTAPIERNPVLEQDQAKGGGRGLSLNAGITETTLWFSFTARTWQRELHELQALSQLVGAHRHLAPRKMNFRHFTFNSQRTGQASRALLITSAFLFPHRDN